ncbi:MAG: HupE/UreJ family protein [Xenococcaceae cyanobacterium]
MGLLSFAQQAMAHHPFGGESPENFFQGLLSGIGHPVIGLDHLAFVIASGLLASGLNQGIFIPVAFVLATMVGTGIHLQAVDLPAAEIIISASVVVFGVLLAIRNTKDNPSNSYTIALTAVAAIAGIFHGYAYGEAIVGAEMTALVAYLAGFAITQLVIAVAALAIGKVILEEFASKPFPVMRFLGFAIGAIGVVFLTSSFVG